MSDTDSFGALIRRVRAGDEEAATRLVEEYEPQIRREVRIRLADTSLRRIIDSVDICQSVLLNFFVRAALGQFDLEDPGQLRNLLITMAQNKVRDWARKMRAGRRDTRRERALDSEARNIAGKGPTPSAIVSAAELVEVSRSRLSAVELEIVDRRAAGADWAEISAALGGTPDALRMRLTRALDRVSQELGLEDLLRGRGERK